MRFRTLIATALVAVSACGGAPSDQDKITDMVMQAAIDEGLELDKKCVSDLAAQISDADAKIIIDAGISGTGEVSEAATTIGLKMVSCTTNTDVLIETLVSELSTIEGLDADCLRSALKKLEPAQLGQPDDPSGVQAAVIGCISASS